MSGMTENPLDKTPQDERKAQLRARMTTMCTNFHAAETLIRAMERQIDMLVIHNSELLERVKQLETKPKRSRKKTT